MSIFHFPYSSCFNKVVALGSKDVIFNYYDMECEILKKIPFSLIVTLNGSSSCRNNQTSRHIKQSSQMRVLTFKDCRNHGIKNCQVLVKNLKFLAWYDACFV